MIDLSHEWGADLAVGPSGDLALTSEGDITKQRVIRRLLTNSGDYLWHLDYGAGLAMFVGTPARPTDLEAVIRNQLLNEASVAQDPIPDVKARIADLANGYVFAEISYQDVDTQSTVPLAISIGI